MGTRKPSKPYPAELRERAVRLVREQEPERAVRLVREQEPERAVRLVREQEPEHASQAAAIRSIAEKVGCHAETLRLWVRQVERDHGQRAGLTTDERERLRALERENRELRQADDILGKASAYFAQAELDRRFEP